MPKLFSQPQGLKRSDNRVPCALNGRFGIVNLMDINSRLLPMFAGVSDDTFQRVTEQARFLRAPANTTLLLEGDAVDFLHVLLSGQVELQGSWKDRETTVAVLRPMSSFILAAVVLDAAALMSARTLEPSELLLIPGAAIRGSMTDDVAFAAAIARELSGSFRTMVRTIKNHKLRNGNERLVNYLLMLRAKTGSHSDVKLPHEKRVLASLLGMTPENLSRAFSTLTEYGVSVDGQDIHLGRLRDLERLARPEPLIDNYAPKASAHATEADAEIWSASHSRRSKRNRSVDQS